MSEWNKPIVIDYMDWELTSKVLTTRGRTMEHIGGFFVDGLVNEERLKTGTIQMIEETGLMIE